MSAESSPSSAELLAATVLVAFGAACGWGQIDDRLGEDGLAGRLGVDQALGRARRIAPAGPEAKTDAAERGDADQERDNADDGGRR